jgi:hypothetical protein
VAVAVTQQIARLTADELAECRRSLEAIDRLCSFDLRPEQDHLDLDWAPRPLEQAATRAGLPAPVIEALRRACAGGEEINPAYREVAYSVWEHPVTALEPEDVREVAAVLEGWSGDAIIGDLATDAATAAAQLGVGELADDPRGDLGGHYEALRRFYLEAAARELATAMWWD